MSFREKSAWISLISTLLVWSIFFMILIREVGSHQPNGAKLIGTFIGCTILLTIIMAGIHIVVAICSPKEAQAARDERERLIDLKAIRAAFVVQTALVMTSLIFLPALTAAGPRLFPSDPSAGVIVVFGGTVFLAVVLGSVVHYGAQVLSYRRSA